MWLRQSTLRPFQGTISHLSFVQRLRSSALETQTKLGKCLVHLIENTNVKFALLRVNSGHANSLKMIFEKEKEY